MIAVRTPRATTVYAYDALGQLTGLQNLTPDGVVDPNAPSAAQVTDPYNGTAHSILSAFSGFTYDLLGDRTGLQFAAMSYVGGSASFGSGTAAWGYAAGRLTSEAWTGVSFASAYAYDGGDNLTSLRGTGLGVDAASDSLSGASVNASGDVLAAGNGALGYDQRGYLTSATGSSTFNTNETYTLTPSYDEAGRRRSQTLGTFRQGLNNAWTDAFVYDGDLLVFRARSGSTSVNGASDLSSSDANVLHLWGPTGPVVEFDLSGHSKALTFDPEGSCLGTTDGQVVQPVFYDAYGKPINAYAGDDRVRQQPFQYKGQAGYYTDAYSGLDYCLHRYYDPSVGRWTQRDPIGLEGGVNVYAYCSGNPVTLVDPSGLDWRSFSNFWAGLGDHVSATLAFGSATPIILQKLYGTDSPTQAFRRALRYDSRVDYDANYAWGDGGGYLWDFALGGAMGGSGRASAKSVAQITINAENGAAAEGALRAATGGVKKFFPTTFGPRFIDCYVNGFANESKVGYTTFGKLVRSQIAKDAELIRTKSVKAIYWHFYRSPVTGKIGMSQSVFDALRKAGIRIVIH